MTETFRLIVGGMPERSMAEGIAMVLRGDDAPPFLTFTVEAEATEHAPHHGNHDGYACGFSGPHCWACNEPWPCRSFVGPA